MNDKKPTRVQILLTETEDIFLKQCTALFDGNQKVFLRALIDKHGTELVNYNRSLLGKPKMTKEDIQEGRNEPKRRKQAK